MPAKKKNLQTPSAKADEFVKPRVPSSDMWERLDKEVEILRQKKIYLLRPPESFTRIEYQVQTGLTRHQVIGLLQRLVEAGIIKRFDKRSNPAYYVFVDGQNEDKKVLVANSRRKR